MSSADEEIISVREAEVLDELGGHLTNAEIAQKLHISVRTVESHVSSLLRKLGLGNRRDLAEHASRRARTIASPGIVGLPSTWTTFIGRTAEIQDLVRAFDGRRLVSVVGPGGIGKTRIAVESAFRLASGFPGGGAFVDLVPVGPGFVVQAVASALSTVEHAQEPLEEAIFRRLRSAPALIVLDNCEHVLGPTASLTESVLSACPQVSILATSRERLGLPGEKVVLLPPLALSDRSAQDLGSEAESLFLERMGDEDPSEADRGLISEICRRLDGMPLAIELAAARSSSLGLDGLLSGLDDHLRILTRPSSGVSRHGSIRALIEWSYELLAEDEKAAFRELGVFAGSFDLRSAATILDIDDVVQTGDLIGRLSDKSLLERTAGDFGSRWRMLESVHAYAREQLANNGEVSRTRSGHLLWAAITARAIEADLIAGRDWQSSFDTVSDDLRSALTNAPVGKDHVDFDLALTLAHLSYARRFLFEARSHFQTAVDRAPDDAAAAEALGLAASEALAEMRGETAFDLLRLAEQKSRKANEPRLAAIALSRASVIGGRAPALFSKHLTHPELVELTRQARDLYEDEEDLELSTHLALASAWDSCRGLTLPDTSRAEAALEVALAYGDPVLLSSALDALCVARATDGSLKEASHLSRERLALLDRLPRHDPRVGGEVADIYHMATDAALGAGELENALAAAQMASLDATSAGLPHFSSCHLVMPLVLEGAFDEALEQASIMSEGWHNAGRHPSGWMAPSFYCAALVYGLRGDEQNFTHWWDLAGIVNMHTTNVCRLYATSRLALHRGLADPIAEVSPSPDPDHSGTFEPYATGTAIELDVYEGNPGAEVRLAAALARHSENDFLSAQLLRVDGLFHNDQSKLREAVAAWESIGARFERACTLFLLPDRANEGADELLTLGCTLPSPFCR
jgi:predicted ATPase/DNA-binding CsgD family transcriptional regulator